MPRKFLKRLIPNHKTLQKYRYLRKFNQCLTEPKLWYLNRKSVASGAALGLFISFMPIFGQMIITAALAILFRVNLPISLSAVWVSNPLTMAPIYFYTYQVGSWVLQAPIGHRNFALSWEWFSSEFLLIWRPLLLGCIICGVISAILGIIFVRLLWRLLVIHHWQKRKNKK